MNPKWYRSGLKFSCTQCGKCCSGSPGFVWVNAEEVANLAQVMEMSLEKFQDQCVRRVGNRWSLKEYPDGDCILLDPDTRTCLAYAARPIQCRTWPFWSSNLKTQKSWKETCDTCPGAGSGKLYTLEQIEVQRKARGM
ncbi:MAG: YkgJ family cysteine cluster protein [Planctomycetales bacterium]|nr:YkgJ family cysteine cluster protein [Planctomycetales bacterium]